MKSRLNRVTKIETVQPDRVAILDDISSCLIKNKKTTILYSDKKIHMEMDEIAYPEPLNSRVFLSSSNTQLHSLTN